MFFHAWGRINHRNYNSRSWPLRFFNLSSAVDVREKTLEKVGLLDHRRRRGIMCVGNVSQCPAADSGVSSTVHCVNFSGVLIVVFATDIKEYAGKRTEDLNLCSSTRRVEPIMLC